MNEAQLSSYIREILKSKKIKEGTCGYGIDGELGDEPAGPHLTSEGLSPEVAAKAEQIKSTMIGKNRDKLFKMYGKDAEKVAQGRAITQAKKALKNKEKEEVEEVYSEKQRKWACAQDDPKFDEMCKDTAISKKKKTMENTRLQELVKSALKAPVKETRDSEEPMEEYSSPVSKKKLGKGPGTAKKMMSTRKMKTPSGVGFSMDYDVNEDKVKGSNIKKVGDKWRILSGKTGKMWKAEYDSKEDAEAGLRGYFASQNESLAERILNELRGNINEMAGEDLELKSLAKKMIPTLKKSGFEVEYSTDTSMKTLKNAGDKFVALRVQDGMLGAHIPHKSGLDAAKEVQKLIQKSLGNEFEYSLTTSKQGPGLKFFTVLIRNK